VYFVRPYIQQMLSIARRVVSRRPRISEVEKLKITNCYGRQYRTSSPIFVTQESQSEYEIERNLSETFDCCVLISADDASVGSASDGSSSFDSDYDLCSYTDSGKKGEKVALGPDVPALIHTKKLGDDEIDPEMPGLIPRMSNE